MIYNRPVNTRRLLVWELLELSTQRHHDSEGLQSLLKRKAGQQNWLMFRLTRIRTLHGRSRRFLLHCARARRLLSRLGLGLLLGLLLQKRPLLRSKAARRFRSAESAMARDRDYAANTMLSSCQKKDWPMLPIFED